MFSSNAIMLSELLPLVSDKHVRNSSLVSIYCHIQVQTYIIHYFNKKQVEYSLNLKVTKLFLFQVPLFVLSVFCLHVLHIAALSSIKKKSKYSSVFIDNTENANEPKRKS